MGRGIAARERINYWGRTFISRVLDGIASYKSNDCGKDGDILHNVPPFCVSILSTIFFDAVWSVICYFNSHEHSETINDQVLTLQILIFI